MCQEKRCRIFTCDRCKIQEETDLIDIKPQNWECIIMSKKRLDFCGSCYEKFIKYMDEFLEIVAE